jgi:hypothetical protein
MSRGSDLFWNGLVRGMAWGCIVGGLLLLALTIAEALS